MQNEKEEKFEKGICYYRKIKAIYNLSAIQGGQRMSDTEKIRESKSKDKLFNRSFKSSKQQNSQLCLTDGGLWGLGLFLWDIKMI